MARAGGNNFFLFLFTLGVIGWGFFAIARLTDEKIENKNFRKRELSREKSKGETWLSTWKSWLLQKLIEQQKKEEIELRTLSSQKEKIYSTENEIPLIEDPIPEENFMEEKLEKVETLKKSQENSNIFVAEEKHKQKQKIYLYQLGKNGQVELKGIYREIEPSEKAAITAVIAGPTAAEEGRNFIDSFPTKPQLLTVKKDGDTLILNFDNKFGLGVSHSTLKYQIQQLYYTAREFSGIKAISVQIAGKYQRHIGGDGLAIPKRIDLETLKSF